MSATIALELPRMSDSRISATIAHLLLATLLRAHLHPCLIRLPTLILAQSTIAIHPYFGQQPYVVHRHWLILGILIRFIVCVQWSVDNSCAFDVFVYLSQTDDTSWHVILSFSPTNLTMKRTVVALFQSKAIVRLSWISSSWLHLCIPILHLRQSP